MWNKCFVCFSLCSNTELITTKPGWKDESQPKIDHINFWCGSRNFLQYFKIQNNEWIFKVSGVFMWLVSMSEYDLLVRINSPDSADLNMFCLILD